MGGAKMMNEEQIEALAESWNIEEDIAMDALETDPTPKNHRRLIVATKVAAVLREIVEG
jgi:hypothetical protein